MSEQKPILKLTDLDGNAFFIIGRARDVAKKAGWSEGRIGKFVKEAMDGNYDHLLQICMEYFDVE